MNTLKQRWQVLKGEENSEGPSEEDGSYVKEIEGDELGKVENGNADEFTQEYDEDKKEAAEYDVDDISDSSSDAYSITGKDVKEMVPIEEDYKDIPVLTIRMWVLAFGLSCVISGVDGFFTLRYPTINISNLVATVVVYPLGQLWYLILPQWNIPLPYGRKVSLNPGPFNQKEHACVHIFCQLSIKCGLIFKLVIEQGKFFENNIGIPRYILFHLSCFMLSFGLAGTTRDILVTPKKNVWPAALGSIALFKALHSNENHIANGWHMNRFKWLLIVFSASFVWYWFPDLILPFLSTLGGWISWIKPSSVTLSQVFGTKTGLGLFPLTLDWTQVTSLAEPLMAPFWALTMIFLSFVFWIWIVVPGLYYQNHWLVAHFPIMTSSLYQTNGKKYQASKVVEDKVSWNLDVDKYNKYSPVMLPIAFIMQVALGLGAFTAMIIQFVFRFKQDIIEPLREKKNDIFNKAQQRYKPYPSWISIIFIAIGLGLGFAFSEGWSSQQLDAGGYIVSAIMGMVLYVPIALIESRSAFTVSLAPFFYIVCAYWYKGKPVTLSFFYAYGYTTLQHAMHTSQSCKIGHYMNVPPRYVMIVLFFASIWGALVSSSVTGFIVNHFHGVCQDDSKNGMTCRKVKTQFNTHLIWGLFGDKLFGAGGRYSFVNWFFLAGALLSLVVIALQWWKPRNGIIQKFNPTLFFAGAENIPLVTGFNYSTYWLVALIFNFIIHRKYTPWWRKYNLVMGIGLDCGTAIAALLIFFAVVYTGGSDNYNWWGTKGYKQGCDSKGCPHLSGEAPKPTGF